MAITGLKFWENVTKCNGRVGLCAVFSLTGFYSSFQPSHQLNFFFSFSGGHPLKGGHPS